MFPILISHILILSVLELLFKTLKTFAREYETVWTKCNGLGRKLSEYVERDIIEHHCLAHRLHLAIRRAFTKSEKYDRDNPPLKFMNHLEILLNKLYRQVLAHIRMVNGLLVFVLNLQASLF